MSSLFGAGLAGVAFRGAGRAGGVRICGVRLVSKGTPVSEVVPEPVWAYRMDEIIERAKESSAGAAMTA